VDGIYQIFCPKGFKGAAQKVESAPAKHLRTALGQIANFFYTFRAKQLGPKHWPVLIRTWHRLSGMMA